MVDIKAGPLFLHDWAGAGENILLLHGMAGHSHWWDLVAECWQGKFRAVALDFRGHGDSDWTPDGIYTADLWVQDIENARKALGWERFLLCGHSMGGRMALNYAERYPGFLRGVVAVDFLPEVRANRPSRFARASARPQPVYASREDAVARFRLEPGGTSLSSGQLRALGLDSVRERGEGWTWKFDWRCLRVGLPPVWPQLPKIGVPALVVSGSLSEILNSKDFARVAAGLCDAKAITILGAHHHVPLDKPAELAAAIADFEATLPR